MDAVNLLREIGWFPVSAEDAGVRNSELAGFQKHFIRFAKDGLAFDGERVEDLKIIELSPVECGLYAQAAHSLICDNVEVAPINSTQLLEERRNDDKSEDLWSTYNVGQENIMKGGLKDNTSGQYGRISRTTTRPVKAIDKNVKLKQALWTLTEKMAELKGQ